MSTLPIGKYRAVAVAESAQWGTTPKTGADFLEVTFRVIEEGPHKDSEMKKSFWFSEAARKYSFPDLRTCGCTFPGGDMFNLAGLGSREVEIVVQKEKPKDGETESKFHEIRFINDPNGRRSAPAMDEARKEALRQQMRGAVLASEAEAKANGGPTVDRKDDLPF